MFCAYKSLREETGKLRILRGEDGRVRSNKRRTRLYLTARMGVFRLGEKCIFRGIMRGYSRIKCTIFDYYPFNLTVHEVDVFSCNRSRVIARFIISSRYVKLS